MPDSSRSGGGKRGKSFNIGGRAHPAEYQSPATYYSGGDHHLPPTAVGEGHHQQPSAMMMTHPSYPGWPPQANQLPSVGRAGAISPYMAGAPPYMMGTHVPPGRAGAYGSTDAGSGGEMMVPQPFHPPHQHLQHPFYYPQDASQHNPYFPPSNFPPQSIAPSSLQQQATNTPLPNQGATSSFRSQLSSNVPPLNNEQRQVVQQDIDRGLRIDFYAENDAVLLASWASFFRDQFIEARNDLEKASYDKNAETYRRVNHFLERVESKIIDTNAMKRFFRRHPLVKSDDPTFVDVCYRTIIDYFMRNPPFDGFTFGNPSWRDYMWFKAGLMKIVETGRKVFLLWYRSQIEELVVAFIEQEVSIFNIDEAIIKGELLEASTSAMQKPVPYSRAKRFYAFLYDEKLTNFEEKLQPQGEAAGNKKESSGTTAIISNRGKGEGTEAHRLMGKKVREVFVLEEEAFILAVVQLHLSGSTTVPKMKTAGEVEGEKSVAAMELDGPTSPKAMDISTHETAAGGRPTAQGNAVRPQPQDAGIGASSSSSQSSWEQILGIAEDLDKLLANQEESKHLSKDTSSSAVLLEFGLESLGPSRGLDSAGTSSKSATTEAAASGDRVAL